MPGRLGGGGAASTAGSLEVAEAISDHRAIARPHECDDERSLVRNVAGHQRSLPGEALAAASRSRDCMFTAFLCHPSTIRSRIPNSHVRHRSKEYSYAGY